jgi:hypothetical protein
MFGHVSSFGDNNFASGVGVSQVRALLAPPFRFFNRSREIINNDNPLVLLSRFALLRHQRPQRIFGCGLIRATNGDIGAPNEPLNLRRNHEAAPTQTRRGWFRNRK